MRTVRAGAIAMKMPTVGAMGVLAGLGAVLCGLMTWAALGLSGQAQPPAETPLRHVVLFKFKPQATPQQIQTIVEAFQQLPQKIEGITGFEWGTDVSPEGLSEGFTHCFVVTFRDAKARDAYLPHPEHQKFVALLRPQLEKVLVVDYFARK
jgi:quinol monooxygenase YgiN